MKPWTRGGVRDWVKIVISGSPVPTVLAKEIGADGYIPDPASAGVVLDNSLALTYPHARRNGLTVQATTDHAEGSTLSEDH